MCRRHTAAAVSLLATAAMLAGAVPHAAAQSSNPSRAVLRDGADDVWTSLPSPSTYVPAPGAGQSVDLTRVVISHRHRALGIQMKFVDLQPQGTQTELIGLETPFIYTAMVRASPQHPEGTHGLSNGTTEISCPGMTHEIDYAEDRIRLRIPRSCIEEPDWVSVRMFATLTGHPAGSSYNDNPHNDQALSAVDTGVGPLYREGPEEATTQAVSTVDPEE